MVELRSNIGYGDVISYETVISAKFNMRKPSHLEWRVNQRSKRVREHERPLQNLTKLSRGILEATDFIPRSKRS